MPATLNMPVVFASKPTCIAILVTCLSSGAVLAQEQPPTSSAAYYAMEGSGSNSSALNPDAISRSNPFGSDLRLPTSCEIWNHREDLPDYLVKLIEDYIDEKIGNGDKLVGQLVLAVGAAAQLAVVAALERALPSLYDFMTQLNSGLESTLEISTNSCEVALQNRGNGQGILDAWYDVSTNIAWRDLMSGGGAYGYGGVPYDGSADMTLNEAAQSMDRLSTETGVPWVRGQRAGADPTENIHIVRDTIREGFGVMNGEAFDAPNPGANVASTPTTTVVGIGGASDAQETRLVALFPESDDAVDFAIMVLGEEEVSLCRNAGCNPASTQGVGLYSAYTQESDILIANWNTLLGSFPDLSAFPTRDDFDTVSSESSKITLTVWRRLIDLPVQDRNAYISRLVSDIALENTVEKAMAIRQMLLSGERAPEIQALGVVLEKTKRMSDLLLEASNVLIEEVNIKGRLASNTALTILRAGVLRDNEGGGLPINSGVIERGSVLRDGSIQPE